MKNIYLNILGEIPPPPSYQPQPYNSGQAPYPTMPNAPYPTMPATWNPFNYYQQSQPSQPQNPYYPSGYNPAPGYPTQPPVPPRHQKN